ncbi:MULTISPECIES: thioredoxin family protein [Flavobacteriaceae]|uniref:thioredoxin family protein n=1 Tax=Flavobacteriaceae TaxID=49546 RepID=UPI0014919968|nr:MULTISPECIES: thioredoxin family protein [Allomuricauda]MDC6365451.1 thioredoxin family protein [Muricauda sp. AC10]
MEAVENNLKKEPLQLVLEGLAKGMSYEQYRDLVEHLAESHQTTGPVQSEANISYTQLGDRRMKRWDKTFKIPSDLQEKIAQLDASLEFLVLTESWCGDAAPSLPIINKFVALNPNFDLKIVLRDENLELMDAFLTNGTRSIPKLIILDKKNNEVVGEWGPRPSIATKMVQDFKAQHGQLTADFKKDLQLWYNKNKGENILEDLKNLLRLK